MLIFSFLIFFYLGLQMDRLDIALHALNLKKKDSAAALYSLFF